MIILYNRPMMNPPGQPCITTLLIDLDDTVYPPASGLWPLLGERMDLYMRERMQFAVDDIPALRQHLYSTYGTTLRGLQTEYHVDAHDFLAFVHDVPLAEYIAPDPELRAALLALPQRKFIFTNADQPHARRVLDVLNLRDCFEDIIGILEIAPYCKPMPESFAIAMRRAGATTPAECLFADDAPHNLAGAKAAGLYTVRVGSSRPAPEYHAAIPDLASLASVIPCNGSDGAVHER